MFYPILSNFLESTNHQWFLCVLHFYFINLYNFTTTLLCHHNHICPNNTFDSGNRKYFSYNFKISKYVCIFISRSTRNSSTVWEFSSFWQLCRYTFFITIHIHFSITKQTCQNKTISLITITN